MWPFRRKSALPPPPIPEPLPRNAAVEWRIIAAFEKYPEAIDDIQRSQPQTLLIHLDEVGTAAADVKVLEDGRLITRWHTWLPYDRHWKKRGDDAQIGEEALKRGITTTINFPTSALEQVKGCVVLQDSNGNMHGVQPLLVIDG